VLEAALTAAGIPLDETADWRALGGGTFNSVYLVRRPGEPGLVVKIPPPSGTPLMSYERGILTSEALYYELAGRLTGVTLPSVVAGDTDYLVMTECPGTPWSLLAASPNGQEMRDLRTELGRQVGLLHSITGAGFGYPSRALGPLRETWREAFLGMVDAVLADAETFMVPLPRPAGEIRDLFAAHAPVLDEVTTPVLVHFDLWDGNILVDSGASGPRIGALIDAERAFWGDPLAEFVSLALFGDIETDMAFLDGYRSAGGAVTFGPATRLRLALYRSYLYLIMWVEVAPREYDEKRRAWLVDKVLLPLTATLNDWNGPANRENGPFSRLQPGGWAILAVEARLSCPS